MFCLKIVVCFALFFSNELEIWIFKRTLGETRSPFMFPLTFTISTSTFNRFGMMVYQVPKIMWRIFLNLLTRRTQSYTKWISMIGTGAMPFSRNIFASFKILSNCGTRWYNSWKLRHNVYLNDLYNGLVQYNVIRLWVIDYDTLKYTMWVSTFAVYALPFRLYRIGYTS